MGFTLPLTELLASHMLPEACPCTLKLYFVAPVALDVGLKGQIDVGKYFRVGEQRCESSNSLSAWSLLGVCPGACGRDSGGVILYLVAALCGRTTTEDRGGVQRAW